MDQSGHGQNDQPGRHNMAFVDAETTTVIDCEPVQQIQNGQAGNFNTCVPTSKPSCPIFGCLCQWPMAIRAVINSYRERFREIHNLNYQQPVSTA